MKISLKAISCNAKRGFILLFVSVFTMGFMPAEVVKAATVTTVIASSQDGTNVGYRIGLEDYARINKQLVNWPSRVDGCSGADYKTIPWLPQNTGVNMASGSSPSNYAGNTLTTEGNCVDRFVDGGSAQAGTAGNDSPDSGAWVSTDYLGGWARGGNGGLSSDKIVTASSTSTNCNNVGRGNTVSAPRIIWAEDFGGVSEEVADQYYGRGGLRDRNGESIIENKDALDGKKLYSNGTSLFRNSFTLTAADVAAINQGRATFSVSFSADDWVKVYVNGTPIDRTIVADQLKTTEIPISLLRPAGTPNTVAFQVIDKSIWANSIPARDARQSWLCYNVLKNVVDAVVATPAPTPIPQAYYPSIKGRSSDIHAGGGVCDTQTAVGGSGNIHTGKFAQSSNEYIVSAAGTTDNLTSDNDLGAAGGYHSTCRPNISNTALTFIQGSPASTYVTIAPGTYSIGNLESRLSAQQSVIYVNGNGNITLTGGIVTRRMSLYTAGEVSITGNISTGSVNATGRQQASLGMVAGSIGILPSASRVDAYMFAADNINTCAVTNYTQAAGNSQCRNNLTVNGFLMAKNFSLRRSGTQSNPTGELVTLTAQLYLNPPPFFDNSADINTLQSQGERPPLQ